MKPCIYPHMYITCEHIIYTQTYSHTLIERENMNDDPNEIVTINYCR